MAKTVLTLAVLAVSGASAWGQGIAQNYPGDTGIQNDPNVVFVEKFDDATLTPVFARWTDVRNGAAMSLVADVPPGSAGTRSLNIDGPGGGGHLYRPLAAGINDFAYLRYYVKYLSGGNYHHSGGWIGGYNPSTAWPQGGAGIRPTGSDRFSVGLEPIFNDRLGFYAYWMGMQPDGNGDHWGNIFEPAPALPRDTWSCVEVMVKLNNPTSSTNGELAYWLNGTKIMHFAAGSPNVTRSGGRWTINPAGTPFPGFQWRNTGALAISWIWFQNYIGTATPPGTLRYDHIVLAKSYIGPISGGGGPATAPAITQQTQNRSVTAGQTATFSVTASGTAPLAYQWQKQDPGGAGFTDIAGATAASYTTPAATLAMSGTQYRVRVSNSVGSVTSSAASLTVTTTPTAPAFTQQPQNRTVTAGQTATFSVTATGTAPLAYQWQSQLPGASGFTDIAGATAASFTTPTTTTAMNGTQYRVRVSNAAGNVISSAATLTVSAASSDSDSDGLPDGWEQQHFGGLSQTGSGDPDEDTHSNFQEFQAGTDPMDPTSSPGAVPTSGSSGGSDDHKPCGLGSVGAHGSTWPLLLLTAVSAAMTLIRRRQWRASEGRRLGR